MFFRLLLKLLHQLMLLTPIVCLLFVIGLVVADQINQEIFSPQRRAMHSYHLERLQHPKQYGMKIQSYDCLNGKAPCLLVEADKNYQAGQRGKILRQQLAQKGIVPPKYGTTLGTIVLLHGRNGRKEDLLPVAERFIAAGFRCLLPDLPGHGDSPLPAMAFGSSQFERDLPEQILIDARKHFKLPEEPAILWGMSMGGAFAISSASVSEQWDALVVVSSFASLDKVLQLQVPKSLGTLNTVLQPLMNTSQWLRGKPSIDSMQPAQWAQRVSLPTLVIHGERDVYVPMRHGHTLYSALNSKHKRWLTVPNGGHANVLATPMQLYAEMSKWLLQTISKPHIAQNSLADL